MTHLVSHLLVQNIPKFRDSCDVMELLFLRKMADETRFQPRVHCFEALRNISKTFHEIYTIFKSAAYRKPYWKCLVKYSAHFVPYFSFKQRDTGEILLSFQAR